MANKAILNPAPWIPRSVAKFINSAFQEPHDQPGLDRLRRLIESPDMRSAWKILSKTTTRPTDLIAFARQATFSLWLSWGQKLLPSSTPAKQRALIRKVASDSHKLLKHLQTLGEGKAVSGAQLLATAAHRAELDAYKSRFYSQIPRLANLRHLGQGLGATGAINSLQWLLEVSIAALEAPDAPGPRKLRSNNAVRTAYVMELAHFVQTQFKKPLFALVATTTNVMFEEFDRPLTADHVRKLIYPPQKIPRKKPR